EVPRAEDLRRIGDARQGERVAEIGPGLEEGDAVGPTEGRVEADLMGIEGDREDQGASRLPERGVLGHPVGLLHVGAKEAAVIVVDVAEGILVVEARGLDGRLEAVLEDILADILLYQGIVRAPARGFVALE